MWIPKRIWLKFCLQNEQTPRHQRFRRGEVNAGETIIGNGEVAILSIRWTLTRQNVWSGNQMTLQRAISGIHHAIKSYSIKKEDYHHWLSVLSLPATS